MVENGWQGRWGGAWAICVGWAAVLLLASGCGGEAPEELSGLCLGVTCSGHGECRVDDETGLARCDCQEGFVSTGTMCVAPAVEPAVVAFYAKAPITEGETAIFVLQVTGPADEPDPVTAWLESPSGEQLAPFELAGPRHYLATLSWEEVNALTELTFLQPVKRPFVARVTAGKQELEPVTAELELTCLGHGCCRGRCEPMMSADQLLLAPADCAAWECSEKAPYPVACLHTPVAWLWFTDSAEKKLLADVKADIEVDGFFMLGDYCGPVGVELHGGLARSFEKKSFKVKFNREGRFPFDPFLADRPPSPVGFKQLIFKAHWVDPSLLRDRFTNETLTLAGGLAPRVTHMALMLKGNFHGLYALTESITEDFFERLGLPSDGNLYKAVNHYANFGIKEDPLQGYEKKMNERGSSDDIPELLAAIKAAPTSFAAFEEQVGPLIDLDLYLLFTLVNAYANNRDSFTKNYYLYHELAAPDQPFLIVNWDSDATWGLNWNGAPEPAATGPLWGKKNYLSSKLSAIPEFAQLYRTSVSEALEGILAPTKAQERLQAIAQTISPDIPYEECRWQKERTFDQEYEVISNFLEERAQLVTEMLAE